MQVLRRPYAAGARQAGHRVLSVRQSVNLHGIFSISPVDTVSLLGFAHTLMVSVHCTRFQRVMIDHAIHIENERLYAFFPQRSYSNMIAVNVIDPEDLSSLTKDPLRIRFLISK